MAHKEDYQIKNLTKIVTTIGEFSTEKTTQELDEIKLLAVENKTSFDFPSLIQEFSFGNRLNHCIETIKLN